MQTDEDRRAVVRAVHRLLEPGGHFVFDVFWPGPEDIAETHGRWLEREPGIFERADWDETDPDADPARPRRRRRVGALARLDLDDRVARAPRQRGLRRRGPLRLVRRHRLVRPRGLDLGLPQA